jgi:hypothetical protein
VKRPHSPDEDEGRKASSDSLTEASIRGKLPHVNLVDWLGSFR